MVGAVPGSVWQPAQPVMTAAICMMTGREKFDTSRVVGILVAFLACAGMVALSASDDGGEAGGRSGGPPGGGESGSRAFRGMVGNLFFFVNCLSSSLYIIMSKHVLRVYPALFVTAWMYLLASMFMVVTSVLMSLSPSIMAVLCPDCRDEGGAFHVPPGAIPALVYFVCFASVGSYTLMTWANKYVTGTLVMGYTVLQPVTAAALTWGLVAWGYYPRCSEDEEEGEAVACLEPAGLGSLVGMVGVFAGLAIIVLTEPRGNKDPLEETYKPLLTSDDSDENSDGMSEGGQSVGMRNMGGKDTKLTQMSEAT